ncbi:aldose epimerase family protein [Campylobacter aviculae]|uniref:Aldose 1-epimerase n=1 Tax=Campylobacter aviculae TaxID=2510190 RepID=A0A4U7BV21_9BACT|nr:aldose epimerase family protein [Campylobacter aviculae]TKX32944.1 galactose mutarotase [Campylobacter aviculae]
MKILQEAFGDYNNEKVTRIRLINDNNVEISCLTMGAIWHQFLVPTKNGDHQNLLLSFDDINDYYSNPQNICKSIGRVAGRIKNASYDLNAKHYKLPQNDHGNTLHGGPHGFSTWNWDYSTSVDENGMSVTFQKKIDESMDGFFGEIQASIVYTLDNQNKVSIAYSATSGKEDTLFNPTCHVYFNLSNHRDLTTHELQINSDHILETDEHLIPTGKFITVDNTPYDFRHFKNVESVLKEVRGLDTAYVVNQSGYKTKAVAILRDKESKRQIIVYSDRNGLVVYTPENIEGQNISFSRDKGNLANKNEGIALEAQILPDAIHHENFGDIVLPSHSKQTYHISFAFEQFV